MLIVSLIVGVVVAVLVAKFVNWFFFPYYIPGIQIMKADTLLGYSGTIHRKGWKPDSHIRMIEVEKSMGKVFQFYFLGKLIVMVNDKFLAKHILENVTGKGFFHRGNPAVNPQSILSVDGEGWRKRRIAFRPAFNANHLRNFHKELQMLSKKLCDVLTKSSENKEIVHIDHVFGRLAIDVIAKVAFQFDTKAIENSPMFQKLHEDIRDRFESAWVSRLPLAQFLVYLPFGDFARYGRCHKDLMLFMKMLLDHAKDLDSRGELQKETFAYCLLQFSKSNPDVCELDICYDIYISFIAGNETTAHTLSWFIYSLATNPEVQRKCQIAMDNHDGSDGTKLPAYVEATLKESMRKHAILSGGSMRSVTNKEGFTLSKEILNKHDKNLPQSAAHTTFTQNIHFPADTWFQTNFHVLQTSESNWGAKATEFLPERWLANGHYTGIPVKVEDDVSIPQGSPVSITSKHFDNMPATAVSSASSSVKSSNPLSSAAIYGGGGALGDDLSFAPFSYGQRNCIGMNLALMEMRVSITDLLRDFSFELADKSMHDEAIAGESVFTLRPKDMLPVYVTKRVKHIM